MKRVILVLMMAASAAFVSCAAPSPQLVAKLNAAYHTTFHVDRQSTTN